MKKITLLIAIMLLVVTGGYSQAGLYTFAQSSGTYVPITGGTLVTSATSVDGALNPLDSYVSPQQTFPVPFKFAGANYSNFYVTSNGQVSFGPTEPSSFSYRPLSTSFGNDAIIAPFSADLSVANLATGEIRWEQVGSELVIQWTNFRRYNRAETFNFQVRLNTVTGNIVFVYDGTGSYAASTSYQPQVGLKSSTGAGAYIALTVGASGSWNAPTAITTGVSDTSIATFNGPVGFTSGQTYTFTPAAGCGPTALTGGTISTPSTVSLCSGSSAGTISVTGSSASYANVTFQWEQSTNNGTSWSNITGGSLINAYTYALPAFAGAAIQYRLKTSCSGNDVYSTVYTINPTTVPTTQSTALLQGNSGYTSTALSWTIGNGARRVVYISTTPITDPVSGTAVPAYTAATAYTGTGQQLVYEGTGSSVTVTGLTCGTTYYVKVFDYNRCGSGPYDVYFNTTTATNGLTITTPVVGSLPSANNFTGFTGLNMAAAAPGWFEAAITTVAGATPTTANPAGLTSNWTNSTAFTATTAKINLTSNTKNEWIISPKLAIAAASRVKFKAAITNNGAATASTTGMQGTDDKVILQITTDCGATWTPLYTFSAANTTTLTNALTDFIVVIPSSYIGQTVQIGFQGTEGPVDDTPNYDFHIGSVIVEAIPSCEKPVLSATTNITKNSATINWNAPTLGVPTGYQYVLSTANTTPTGAGTAATGTTANVASLTPSTTYYVFVRTVCGSDFSDWSLSGTFGTLCDYGSVTASTPASRCGAGSITLNATASAGSIIQWFDAATGGNLVGSASALTTNVNATTTFYATSATAATGTATIGTGVNLTSATETLTAFNNRYAAYRMQIVYTAVDLNAAGLAPGNITSLAFRTTTLGDGATNADFTVKMGTIGTATIPSTTFVTTGLNTVYGPVTHTHTASGWQVINLTTPYAWDGTSNVIVEVSHAGADLTNNSITYYTSTAGNTVLFSTGVAPSTGTLDVRRPDIMFAGQAYCRSPRTAVVATVDAPPALTLSGNPAAICVGQTTAAVTITTGASSYDTYVWTPSTGVAGNAATGWTFNPTVSTVYTLQASQSSGTLCNAAPVAVNVTVNALPSAAISIPATITACEQAPQALTLANAASGTVAIGNGVTAPGTTAFPNPFSAYYGGTKTQILFTAAELTAQGLLPGSTINVLSFDFNASVAKTLNDLRIKIGTTTNINTTAGFVSSAALTTVYNATYMPTAGTTGLVPFTLTTPFTWNGGNLIVEIAHNQGNGGNGSGTRTNTTQTTFNSVFSAATDNVLPAGVASYDALTTYGTSSASDLRPNIVFGYNTNNTIVWSPVTNLYTDAAGTVAYTGQNLATVYTKSSANISYTATISNTSGCQITRNTAVTVTIIAAPTVPAPAQTFCNAGTVADLVATGTAVKWYAAATGGNALAATTALVNGTTYYASQTVNGCESVARTARTANINVVAAPVVADDTQEFCNAGTVAELLPNDASIKWYSTATGGTALASTDALASGSYYASQTVNGCEGLTRTLVTVTINVIAAPSINDVAQEFCNAGTVAELVPNDASIKWYADETGGTALASTDALESGSYYASQTVNGCEGLTRTLVTVTVNVIAAPSINETAQEFCNAATVAELVPNDASIKWYADATGGTALASTDALADDTTYYASQTIDTCEGVVRTAVAVTINVTAAPTGDDEQEFCSAATAAELTATGDNLTWYDAATGGNVVAADAALVDGTTYYVSQTIDGCEGLTRFAVTAVIHNVVADAPANVSECTSYELPALTSGAYFTEAGGLGTELAAGTAITETTTLYVYAAEGTDVVCSDENSFVVTIANIAAPTGDSPQTVSVTDAADATIADLVVVAEGTVTWYATEEDAAEGTNALAADTQLTQGATYYAVQTIDTCTSAEALAVTVDVVLGDKGFDVKAFTFHPNPVKDVLNISYSSDITSVTVFNLLGQQVITLKPNSGDVRIDMSSLADAAYIVNITAGNTVKTIKVIKRQ